MPKSSYKDILSQGPENIARLSTKQLRAQVRKLANVVNPRLSRLQKAGLETPATYDPITGRTMTPIRAQGQTRQQLLSEFARAGVFLNAQTSTVSGARKWMNESIQGLEKAGVENVTQENFALLWKSYETLSAMDPAVQSRELKYRVLNETQKEIMAGATDADEIAQKMAKRVDAIYEQSQEERQRLLREMDMWTGDDEEEE